MRSCLFRLVTGVALSVVVLVGFHDTSRADAARVSVPPIPIAIDFSQRPDAAQDASIRERLAAEILRAEETERGRGAQGVVPDIRIGEADVNQDGQTDWFVQIWSMAWCAPTGCNTWLLLNDGHTYRQILSQDGGGLATDFVYVTPTIQNGFRSLIFGDTSATAEFCYSVQWNGIAYSSVGGPPDPAVCPSMQ